MRNRSCRYAENSGRSLGIEVTASHARNDGEIEQAIATVGSKAGGGLIVRCAVTRPVGQGGISRNVARLDHAW